MENNHKICTRCNELKILDNFRFRNNKAISSCKKCEKDYWNSRKDKTAEYHKEYRAINKDELSSKKKQKRIIKRESNNNVDDFDLSLFYDIPNYEGIYKINKNGDVLSLPSITTYSWQIKSIEINKGYERVTLWKNGKGKHFFIHQLLAKVFIPNPENKPHINHINGIKNDNRLENIEWCIPLENITHSIKNNLAGTNRCRKHKTNKSGYIGVHWHKVNKKYVARLRLKNGNRLTIGNYDDVIEAAKAYDKSLFNEWGLEYEFNFARED